MSKVSTFILKYILKSIVLDKTNLYKEQFLENLGLKRKYSAVQDEIEENILYFKYNDVVDELFPYNIPLNEEGKYFHF